MTFSKINDLKLHNDTLHAEIAEAVRKVIDRGWFALGPAVSYFEHEFAQFCKSRYCIGVANGTDALELLLRGLGVDAGDEVVTVANAGMYSTTAILAIGACPRFVDVDPITLNMDAAKLEEAINPQTKAVIATHLFGRMADMPNIKAVTEKHRVLLIEDCAQSHGAEMEGDVAGSWGDGAAFSFYPTKNLGALGDGGAIVVNDTDAFERIRSLRQYGWRDKYVVKSLGGRNSRLDEVQAAVLSVKLQHLRDWNHRRTEIATQYNDGFANTSIVTPPVTGRDYVAHLYVIRCKNRDSLRALLKSSDIACDIHYPLLDYQQPAIRDRYVGLNLPVSEESIQEILTLPCYPEMEGDDVSHVVQKVVEWQR